MRRHALRKSMMEYVFGELKNTNSPNKLTLHKDEATTAYYPEVVSDTTNLKFYYISPSNYNVNTLSDQSLTYNAGGTAEYNGKIIRYSWNWGKRNYSSSEKRTPGVAFSSDLSNIHFVNTRTNAAYNSAIEELYCNTCTNVNAEYDFYQLCYTASNLKKVRFNNYINLSASDEFLYYAFNGCTSLRFVDLGNIFKSNITSQSNTRGTFVNCHDIVINVKDCDFSNASFNTTKTTYFFIPNNSSIVIVYDTIAKLGSMQTKYSSVTYTPFVIMAELSSSSDTLYPQINYNEYVSKSPVGDNNFAVIHNNDALDDSGDPISSITNWTSARNMFYDCSEIVKLDLSLWDTSKIINMRQMFRDCTSLEELNLSGLFTTANVTTYDNIFLNVKSGCKVYYNPDTMKSAIKSLGSSLKWIPVDEHFRLF